MLLTFICAACSRELCSTARPRRSTGHLTSQWRVSEMHRLTIHWRLSKTSNCTAPRHNAVRTRARVTVDLSTSPRRRQWCHTHTHFSACLGGPSCGGGRTSNWIAIDTRLELLSCKYCCFGHHSATTGTLDYGKIFEQRLGKENIEYIENIHSVCILRWITVWVRVAQIYRQKQLFSFDKC